jgi:hypothetical protein
MWSALNLYYKRTTRERSYFNMRKRRVGMSLDDALAMVKRRRPEANPIPEFLSMVSEFSKEETRIPQAIEGDPFNASKRIRTVGPQKPATSTQLNSASKDVHCDDVNESLPQETSAVMIGPTQPTGTTTEAASIGPMLPSESSTSTPLKKRKARP